MASSGPDYSSDLATAEDFALARELGIRITAHVASSPAETGGIERMHAAGLLRPDLTVVHGGAATDHALKLLADHGVTVSVSSQIELGMDGLAVPILGRMLAAGLTPSLSVDTETATAGDMFTQMRIAYAVTRRERLEGRSARKPVSARDVLRWATQQGATANGLDRRTGSLTPGKAADVILIRATDVNLAPVSSPADAIVLGAHAGNVDTMLVAGRSSHEAGVWRQISSARAPGAGRARPRARRLSERPQAVFYGSIFSKSVSPGRTPAAVNIACTCPRWCV